MIEEKKIIGQDASRERTRMKKTRKYQETYSLSLLCSFISKQKYFVPCINFLICLKYFLSDGQGSVGENLSSTLKVTQVTFDATAFL